MHTRSKAVLLTMTAMLAACSENATAPQLSEPAAAVQGSMQDLGPGDTVRFSITLNPRNTTTTVNLGSGNSILFPAGSLCAPNSTYGPTEWDKPCNVATSSVTVNVTAFLDQNGKPRIDFDKHLRFVPGTTVLIQFADLQASLDPFFNILYCPSITTGCYDESKLDPSLITVRNPITGKVTRRIKHFSGYNVAAGRDDGGDAIDVEAGLFNLSPDFSPSFSLAPSDLQLETEEDVKAAYPALSDSDAKEFLETVQRARRSGYILASG